MLFLVLGKAALLGWQHWCTQSCLCVLWVRNFLHSWADHSLLSRGPFHFRTSPILALLSLHLTTCSSHSKPVRHCGHHWWTLKGAGSFCVFTIHSSRNKGLFYSFQNILSSNTSDFLGFSQKSLNLVLFTMRCWRAKLGEPWPSSNCGHDSLCEPHVFMHKSKDWPTYFSLSCSSKVWSSLWVLSLMFEFWVFSERGISKFQLFNFLNWRMTWKGSQRPSGLVPNGLSLTSYMISAKPLQLEVPSSIIKVIKRHSTSPEGLFSEKCAITF